jgi:hypothetical protein
MNEFKQDLQNSNHLWVVDSQSTCGFTQHSSSADIYFSYPTCAATVGNNLNSALFTLIHETAHHLGVDDEKQADLVAQAILDANIAIKCPAATQDVFNPLVCQGPVFTATDAAKYLQPGQSRTEAIGNYQAYARSRSCNYLNGCGAWVADRLLYLYTDGYSQRYVSKVSFVISADLKTPYFKTSILGNITGNEIFSAMNEELAYGVPGALKMDGRYWLTKTGDSEVKQTSGELRQNCGWFRIQRQTANKNNGTYMESEIVVYGQH